MVGVPDTTGAGAGSGEGIDPPGEDGRRSDPVTTVAGVESSRRSRPIAMRPNRNAIPPSRILVIAVLREYAAVRQAAATPLRYWRITGGERYHSSLERLAPLQHGSDAPGGGR